MSNASLKEQLQTLGLSTSGSEKSPPRNQKRPPQAKFVKPNKPNKPNKSNRPAQSTHPVRQSKPKPAWLEQAQYGVELLKAHFPKCFRDIKDLQPLKIGIKQDLVKHLSSREDIVTTDKACMVNSLSYYVNSPAYHKRVVDGIVRIDLEGNPSGVVTADEAKYSVDCRNAKLQKKQNQMDKRKNAMPQASLNSQKSSIAVSASETGINKEEPKVEEPKVEEPKVEEPKVEEPKVEEPKVEEPKAVKKQSQSEPEPQSPQNTETTK